MPPLNDNSPYRSVAGRVAIVTGAASGIGKATALLLARAGVRVVVADVNTPAAETAAAEITREGYDAIACRLDVKISDLCLSPQSGFSCLASSAASKACCNATRSSPGLSESSTACSAL